VLRTVKNAALHATFDKSFQDFTAGGTA